jgi:CelD/BcsL family acetyltransferase involved in cellulose biosynthesis
MKISVIPAGELTPEHASLWAGIHRGNPALDSPYFRPEFVGQLASVRGDVAVAVMEDGGRVCGFLPFQRGRWGIGRPAGWPMSDFHGVVAGSETEWDADELVRAAGLAIWRFDHLPAAQAAFRGHAWSTSPSPYIDLSAGFDAYRKARRAAGSRTIPDLLQGIRAAERRLGPLRFELHTDDHRVFQTLLEWKSRQYRRTGYVNVIGLPWVARLLDRIRQQRGAAFSGVLSALYMGDALAAVHLGMRSYDVLHHWMPAYNVELARYAPGSICLLQLVRAAAAAGIRRIDLGKGLEAYKLQWMSGAVAVAEGAVECRPAWRAASRAWQCARRCTRIPVLGPGARLGARLTRPLRRWWAYQ